MAQNSIPVQDLDFDNIKQSLKDFLKAQTQFQDYDFEGSSMNVLMDLLSYVTHYNGFHAHMLNNESNADSANLKSSLTSKAKFQNYIPGSKKSAEAVVTFQPEVNVGNDPIDRKIVIPRGQTVKANNNVADTRSFVLADDVYIYNQSNQGGVYDYLSDETLIYEGSFETLNFLVDTTILNQRFVLTDPKIDIKSLRVRVYDSENDTNFIVYKQAEDFMNVDADSPVFFVTTNEDDLYEIQFGNGVYGREVAHNNKVECTFIAANGELGNNAKVFTFGGQFNYNGVDYTININTIDILWPFYKPPLRSYHPILNR